MADLTIPKGDKGFYINFTVKNADGTAFDLTGYTITLKVWASSVPGTLVVSGACSIVVAAAGTCRYLVTATDFTTINNYFLELELTQAGVIESTRKYTLEVTESG